MKNEIHNKEEHDEYIDPNEVYREMLELYTMLPPVPFRKKQKKSIATKQPLKKDRLKK